MTWSQVDARLAGIDHHGQHLATTDRGITVPADHTAVVHGHGTINGRGFYTKAVIESDSLGRTATLQVWLDGGTPKARINLE